MILHILLCLNVCVRIKYMLNKYVENYQSIKLLIKQKNKNFYIIKLLQFFSIILIIIT